MTRSEAISNISARALTDASHKDHTVTLEKVASAVDDIGFLTVSDTCISAADIDGLLATYKQFFLGSADNKSAVDMALTGSNRGWGSAGAEQVNTNANPDYKQVFDCGPELAANDPLAQYSYYAPNLWPAEPEGFREVITSYYQRATAVAQLLLSAVAKSIGEPHDYFDDKFDKPMSLLRGNYYPPRPRNATDKDFGIAAHSDYGCLTLLATDGTPGLEVLSKSNEWLPVTPEPGVFVINFGEMLEMWTNGRVVATLHRVVGGTKERLSVPLFFNPRYDVNVAPSGSAETILAGEHLARRYDETYIHRKKAMPARTPVGINGKSPDA